jgi:ubiquinone/menaquinone biosynthesis C-methylase UbiE
MTERDQYFLGYRQAEQERLQRQAQELAHEARGLFGRVGLAVGERVVEIGCGPQGCLDILSELVGPSGHVVGVERSEEAVGFARQLVADRQLSNVEVLHGDARATGLPRGAFDCATARLILVNVPQPEQIVAEAVALVRPGGAVAFHEADWGAHLCDPPLDAWTRLTEVLHSYSSSNGIDLFVGRRVPRLLRQAGLVNVQVHPLVHVYPPGHGRRTIFLDFVENLSERLVGQRLIAERELLELKSALKTHIEDPETLIVSHLFLQVWGRKPGPSSSPPHKALERTGG